MAKKTDIKQAVIPQYSLEGFRPLHRNEDDVTNFGYNCLGKTKMIAGFELFSSAGLKPSLGPLKSAFYRISITIRGSVDVQIGLEHFTHQPRTINFTWPNQVFSKSNISKDIFGYYILFNADFLQDLIPHGRMGEQFPFFDHTGIPFFHLSPEEMERVQDFVLKMNEELQMDQPGKEKAIQMYLYLLLLEARRSYERQQLHTQVNNGDSAYLISRFNKLVGRYFLEKRKVADYAAMLAVTANHLNRMIKEVTGKTASEAIAEMLLREAKAVLKYTDATVAEIAYQLNFSEPAAFNRFFKKMTGETPLDFRVHA